MRFRVCFALLACLICGFVAVLDPPSSAAASRVTLDRPRTTSTTVVLRGSAPRGATVRVVRRTTDGWVRIARDRVNRRGRYRAEIDRPAQSWVVRAVSRGVWSGKRTVPAAPPVEPPPVEPPPVEPPPVEPPPVEPPPDACGARLHKAGGSLWECTFVDNFGGTALDRDKWLAADTAFSGITNGEKGCFVDEPWSIAVSDGTLRLSAVHTVAPFTCDSPFGGFATDRAAAAVTTKGRFAQTLGRFEFRAKMPDTRVRGVHSTLWLYPDKHLYGLWPLSGEVDVAEWFSAHPDQVYPSLHYVGLLSDVHTGHDGIIPDVSRFHTYAVEWTEREMRFYYDDVLVFTHTFSALSPLIGSQPFDKPFNTVLTQAWGGVWNSPVDATVDRATMTVDWVRVWK